MCTTGAPLADWHYYCWRPSVLWHWGCVCCGLRALRADARGVSSVGTCFCALRCVRARTADRGRQSLRVLCCYCRSWRLPRPRIRSIHVRTSTSSTPSFSKLTSVARNIWRPSHTQRRREASVQRSARQTRLHLPASLCVHLKHLTGGGGNDCTTVVRNAGDGNCLSHALLNGIRQLTF